MADAECLYDVVKLRQWNGQRDPLSCPVVSKRQKLSENSLESFLQNVLNQLYGFIQSNQYNSISKTIDYEFLWKIIPAEDSECFTILRSNSIDFFVLKDNSIERKANVKILPDENDAFKYQIGCWDDTSSLFLLVAANMSLRVFSNDGQKLSSKRPRSLLFDDYTWNLSKTPCLATFLQKEPSTDCIGEFITLERSGVFRKYAVTKFGDIDEISENETDITQFNPIVQAEYLELDSNLLLVVNHNKHTWNIGQQVPESATDVGLHVLRELSDGNHFSVTANVSEKKVKNPLLVARMYKCPYDHSRLAILHEDSSISLWSVKNATLEIEQFYSSDDLPFYNQENPNVMRTSKPEINQKIKSLTWWSHDILILSRPNGCVFLLKYDEITSDLELVKDQQDNKQIWLNGNPCLNPLSSHTSLILSPKKILTGNPDENDDDFDTEESNLLVYLSKKIYSYFLDRKQADQQFQTFDYSLFKIKVTTPTELFYKKLENEEYGEALEISQKYDGLDKDQVYQKQWQNCDKSLKSHILDYLAKIDNLSWVFNQCIETVAENYAMQSHILNFALEKCSLATLVSIAKNHKSLDFYESIEQASDPETPEIEYTGFDPELKRKAEMEKHRKIIEKELSNWCKLRNVSKFDDRVAFNLEESEILLVRPKLLHYKKVLDMYGEILGSKDSEFDSEYYLLMRDMHPLDLAFHIAQENPSKANSCPWEVKMEIVLETFWSHIEPHYPKILACINELRNPSEYEQLLPFKTWRSFDTKLDEDWVFEMPFKSDQFFQVQPRIDAYPDIALWYETRAVQIDSDSGQVNTALNLLKLGMENGVDIPIKFYRDFEILKLIIYEYCLTDITYNILSKKTAIEKFSILVDNLPADEYFSDKFEEYTTLVSANSDDLVSEYFTKNLADSELYLTKLFLFFKEAQNRPLGNILIPELLYKLESVSVQPISYDRLLSVIDFEQNRCLNKHFEIYSLLYENTLPLSLKRISEIGDEEIVQRITKSVLNKINKKLTLLDHLTPAMKTEQNLQLLDETFSKFSSIDLPERAAFRIILRDESIDQQILNVFFNDEKYTDIEDLILDSGVYFLDAAETATDSAMDLAYQRFSMIKDTG